MVKHWVEDLVITKTYNGLYFQQAILQRLSTILGLPYRLATAEEESKGIDGYVNEVPVQIKANTYKSVRNERFSDGIVIIYYSKNKRTSDISFEYEPSDFK